MTKALFFDIDGTLVSFNTHRVPQSTIDAVRAARARGIKVFIATGRPRPFINNLGTLEYDGIMSVNGASIILGDGTVVCNRMVPREDVARMVGYVGSRPLPVVFAGSDEAFVVNMNEAFHQVFQLLDLRQPPLRPAEYALQMDVQQVIAFFSRAEEATIMSQVLSHCEANRWHPAFADCILRGTSKATGIDDVCRHYGWRAAEVMAFGDGGNDMAMLRHAGVGVAMGNARKEVQACADYVTSSVDDDGIARALRHFGIV